MKRYQNGFTLIELMIVMIILGVLASLVAGNFFTSLKKGRDARRKADLQNIQKALEGYYEDKNAYPVFNIFASAGLKLCETKADTDCGGEKVYMERIPEDPQADNGYSYYFSTSGDQYKLYSCIENDQDEGQGVNQGAYVSRTCTGCGKCKFGVSSSNTTPDDTSDIGGGGPVPPGGVGGISSDGL
jgi:type II secretion system protein G